jgi:hypothetical protein
MRAQSAAGQDAFRNVRRVEDFSTLNRLEGCKRPDGTHFRLFGGYVDFQCNMSNKGICLKEKLCVQDDGKFRMNSLAVRSISSLYYLLNLRSLPVLPVELSIHFAHCAVDLIELNEFNNTTDIVSIS